MVIFENSDVVVISGPFSENAARYAQNRWTDMENEKEIPVTLRLPSAKVPCRRTGRQSIGGAEGCTGYRNIVGARAAVSVRPDFSNVADKWVKDLSDLTIILGYSRNSMIVQ
jgi:hypothetical protein